MRLQEQYTKKIVPEMIKEFKYSSPMAVPKIDKVIVNVCFGGDVATKGAGDRKKHSEMITEKVGLIAGQKPTLIKAKKSVATFKLRAGMPIGTKVSLRGKRAYQFLEKLIYVVLPRQRDFRGLPIKSITEQGDLTIGFKEYTPFPEVKVEREKGLFGLEITVVSTAKTKKEGEALFRLMGFPLQKLNKPLAKTRP